MPRHETKPHAPSRRDFFAAGTGAIVGGLLMSTVGRGAPAVTPAAAGTPEPAGGVPALPWAYRRLDVELVARRGYEAYFKYACCHGAAHALLTTLRESSGGPWATVPAGMFRYGAGGGLGWGTMCGALNACLAVMNLASARFDELGNELIGWYTGTPLPSARHETYAQVKNQPTTIADSPLCHVSVGRWVDKMGARIHDKDRKDRCAKLTGDTVAMAAHLLNQALDDTLVPVHKPARGFSHCIDCHQGPKSLHDNAQAKSNCLLCHDEHPRPH